MKDAATLLPRAPPRGLTPLHIVLGAIALVAIVAGTGSRRPGLPALLLTLETFGYLAPVAWFVCRRPRSSGMLGRTILGSLLGSLLFGVIQVLLYAPYRDSGILATLVVFLLTGLPMAPAIALFEAPLLIACSRARQEPTHDAIDSVALVASIWTSVLTLPSTIEALVARKPTSAAVSLGVALAAVAVGVSALRRARARRTWLSRVHAGLEPSWKISADVHAEGLLPLFRASARDPSLGCDAVLMHDPSLEHYRYDRATTPVARVSSIPPTDLRLRVWSRYLRHPPITRYELLIAALIVGLTIALPFACGACGAHRTLPPQCDATHG